MSGEICLISRFIFYLEGKVLPKRGRFMVLVRDVLLLDRGVCWGCISGGSIGLWQEEGALLLEAGAKEGRMRPRRDGWDGAGGWGPLLEASLCFLTTEGSVLPAGGRTDGEEPRTQGVLPKMPLYPFGVSRAASGENSAEHCPAFGQGRREMKSRKFLWASSPFTHLDAPPANLERPCASWGSR